MSENRTLSAREIATKTGSKVVVCDTSADTDGDTSTHIGFRSKEGKLLHFVLSADALAALRLLLTDPTSGKRTVVELVPPPQHYSIWTAQKDPRA